jgi:uncharacterized protein YjiS (DUF1127 family)
METLSTSCSSKDLASPYGRAREVVVRRSVWNWFGEWIANFVRKRIAERNARRAIRELEAMSDRELRDIGLHRADIERTVRSKPLSPVASELRMFDRDRQCWR